MIKDTFQRSHTYLRISLTDVCNLRCFYCMPEEAYPFTPAPRLMQAGEILGIAGEFARLGVNKIRLTGGEPLARKDFSDILARLSALPVALTITTNAILLDRYLGDLKEAGVHTLNISLDTLHAGKFAAFTKRDQLDVVLSHIRQATDAGFHIKVNTVVVRGKNESEILDFIAWAHEQAVDVRFIEFMPFAGNRWTAGQVYPMADILRTIGTRYAFEPVPADRHDTATPYRIRGHSNTFAVISTMSAPFCEGCNRLRLTADGKMKNCLFSKKEADLLTAWREGRPIAPLIQQNVLEKEKAWGGQFDADFLHLQGEDIENRSMIRIGG